MFVRENPHGESHLPYNSDFLSNRLSQTEAKHHFRASNPIFENYWPGNFIENGSNKTQILDDQEENKSIAVKQISTQLVISL